MRKVLLVAVLAALVITAQIWGQTPTGAIEGTVTDPTGAAIPNAKLTISELATNRAIQLNTNELGRYSLRNLLPGRYRIKVEAANFSTRVIDNVVVDSGAVVATDIRLEVGRTEQVVQVNAEAVLVDSSRQTVDTVITEQQIKSLPLFTRNFLDLAALAPGTIIRDGESIDPTKAFAYRAVGVNGRSGTGTRVQMDGIDVTDETVGTTVANMSQDAVSEFQLTRSSLDISTSLTSSGAVNIISRSGANDIHGNWFWDYYNQDMGARLNYNKDPQPFKRDRTGGSVSGPFVKDKLFWFANWERHYQTEQKIYESPEFPQLSKSSGFPVGIRYTSGRLDWNASPSLRLFYRFNHSWDLSSGGSVPSPFQNLDWTNTHTVGIDFNRARMTHSYRFGYVNFNNQITSSELGIKFPVAPNGIPYFLGVGTFQAGPNSLAPQQTYQDNYQNSYEGTFFTGRHNLRYGFSVTRIVLGGFANFAGPLSVSGIFDKETVDDLRKRGANLQDPLQYPLDSFSTGPSNGFFTVKPAHGFPHGGHFNTRLAGFAGDSIKAARRLTLNLGLRWEYDTGFFSDPGVKRDPALDRWISGASRQPQFPKNLLSPSFGFAYDPTGSGKTVIRGGFYKAYEMNIFNNTIFDESAMIPVGIGPDTYDITGVTGPDGTPINVDGKHPEGNYEDLIGRPIGEVIGLIAQVHAALNQAYTSYKFDPNKGPSLFTQLKGLQIPAMFPGNQFKIPYSLQFNLGIQRELAPGTVLSVDYVHNHGVGLPMHEVDYERRRDAATLNVAAARTQRDSVLKGMTVDQWIAANPSGNIASFRLVNDTIWQGLYPDFTRAEFASGGFTTYRGMQISLRGRRSLGLLKDASYVVGYALARSETTSGANRVEFRSAPLDNRRWNSSQTFGPNGLDFTHSLRVGASFRVPGGFEFNSLWSYRTAPPITLSVPNFGGAVSGPNGFFAIDVNGDGSRGTSPRPDVLPGVNVGQFGRGVKSFQDLNRIITNFNQNFAGKLTPHGQALVSAGLFTEDQLKRLGAVVPTIPLVPEGNPYPFHNLLTTDLRFDRPIRLGRIREGMQIVPFVDFFNLFNHAPAGVYGNFTAAAGSLTGRFGALNFDYSAAPDGQKASDLNLQRFRLNSTRKVEIGVRFDF